MASQYGASFPVERAKVEAVELTSQGIETTAARGYRVCRWIKQSGAVRLMRTRIGLLAQL